MMQTPPTPTLPDIPAYQFLAAVDRVLEMPDVGAALADPMLQVDATFVREQVLRHKREIEGQLGSFNQEIVHARRTLVDHVSQREALRAPPWYIEVWPAIPGCGLLMLLLLAATAAAGSEFSQDIYVITWQVDYFSVGHAVVLVTAALILAGILASRRWKRRLAAISDAQDNDTIFETVRLRVAEAEQRLDQGIESAVTRTTFEIIGSSGAPFYQDLLLNAAERPGRASSLKASSPRGLSEVPGEGHEVPTAERRNLLHLLETLPGASIGLSGPRGSGKSTLLRSLTASNLRLGEREAIAIYTAAPVEYAARDFLLHIFATLCRRVLATYGAASPTPGEPHSGDGAFLGHGAARSLRASLLLFGLISLLISLAIAWLNYASLPAAASGKAVPSPSFIAVLDIKPGPLLLFGVTALVLWLTLWLSGAFQHRATHEGGSQPANWLQSMWRLFADLRPEPQAPESELVQITRNNLADIRFQRSFTSGWSGAIKVPVGFDLGSSNSTSLAERQESLPELVDRFSNYIRQIVTVHGTVIIAIDELDKLRSGVEAESFINELKSIFNIPRCFYLVSVSEDALSSFERRGLALRDAFDSAFDDIRYVGHMGLNECRKMLTRRVLSLPDPFLCLCYILSGGLPRDLIRAARDMFDLVRPGGPPLDIVTVAGRLLAAEADAKLRSAIAATRNIALEPQTSTFILAVTELQRGGLDDPQFRARVAGLVARRSGDEGEQFSRLEAIQLELTAYLAFLAELLALAKMLATQQGWERAHSSGKIEQLAEIRRSLESNIAAASARLTKIFSS